MANTLITRDGNSRRYRLRCHRQNHQPQRPKPDSHRSKTLHQRHTKRNGRFFRLSPDANENITFLVQRGEIEGRWDASFYSDRTKYDDFVKLKSFVKVKGGKRIPLEKNYADNVTDYYYLRVDNIDEWGNIDINNFKYIDKEVFDILKNYETSENDVIISIAGTIGKTAVIKTFDKPIILTENCAKLIIKNKEELLPIFLNLLLQLSTTKTQIKLSYIQTTIPKLGIERIENLKVPPVPPLEIQQINKGQSITKDNITPGDYPVIAGGQSSPYTHQSYNTTPNAITISASGAYSGYVWYHDYPIFASDCLVIKTKDDYTISTLFLSEVLKLKQKEIYNMQQGAGQPHVYASDIEKLNIPIPPLSKQQEIITHITSLRSEAVALREQAAANMAAAKAEIEAMLLGR